MICGVCRVEGVTVEHVRGCRGQGVFRPKRAPTSGADFFGGGGKLSRPSSDAQRKFIADLRRERGMEALSFTGTSSQAHTEIERLKAIPKPRKKREVAVEDGIYRIAEDGEDVIYKVMTAHYGDAAGYSYAKRLVLTPRSPEEMNPKHPEWVYKGDWQRAPGYQFKLEEGDALDRDEAIQYGKLYGFCVRCGAILENEESIERGMGPVCAGKM